FLEYFSHPQRCGGAGRGTGRGFLKAALFAFFANGGAVSNGRPETPEGYATRLIRIVVPLAAGGVTDTVARTLAARLQQALGQPVVIENRTGGGGAIGAESVARSPADGYTLLMGTVSSNAINASLYRNLRYDNIKDFAPI